jgi:hypothetical protein
MLRLAGLSPAYFSWKHCMPYNSHQQAIHASINNEYLMGGPWPSNEVPAFLHNSAKQGFIRPGSACFAVKLNERVYSYGSLDLLHFVEDRHCGLPYREMRPADGFSCVPGAVIGLVERGVRSIDCIVAVLKLMTAYSEHTLLDVIAQMTSTASSQHLFDEKDGLLILNEDLLGVDLPDITIRTNVHQA